MLSDYSIAAIQSLAQEIVQACQQQDTNHLAASLTALSQVVREELAELPLESPTAASLPAAVSLVHQVLHNSTAPAAGVAALQLFPELHLFYLHLIELRQFILALAEGNLSAQLTQKGYLAGALKALQANLRHLTWQTQMIASGDFSQRIDFMGEFSQAFNAMVLQLQENHLGLQAKQDELAGINRELCAEIERRQQVEDALRQREELYRQLALSDPLTGIFNRRHFYQLGRTEVRRARRYHRPLAVAIFDIDYFKQVNDSFGHAVGDEVLRAFTRLVQPSVRPVDVFARYGGEEFILLLPETDLAGGLKAADRVRRLVAGNPFDFAKRHIKITVSAGVSALNFSSVPPAALEQLINQADQALYEAKNTGRNKVSAFVPPQPHLFAQQCS
jgi:diguanylate cyclase (GGDEF)-like protein